MSRTVILMRFGGAALLLLAGLLLPLVVYGVVRKDFQGAFAAWLIAFPAGAVGFWLWRAGGTARQSEVRYTDLDITFARLLKQDRRISVSALAAAAAISPDEAKRYLDEKALALNATFARNEGGEDVYVFDLKRKT